MVKPAVPSTADVVATADEPQGIQSVEIGFGVLDALVKAGHAMPLGAIARAAGMSTSQARRYLISLMRAGVVHQYADSGLYDMGPGALRIGLAALGRVDPIDLATTAMRSLTLETGEGASLSVWGDAGATVVRWLRGERMGIISVGLGSIFPLYTSATGRVCLARIPEEQTAAILARELGAERATSGDIRREVRRNRAEVLERGYAAMTGHFVQQIRGLAAPILDSHGDLVAVIALVGPLPAAEATEPDYSLRALLNVTRDLSRQLGWRSEEDAPKQKRRD
jgi:DNA-binding IclR family transcriptional regulator